MIARPGKLRDRVAPAGKHAHQIREPLPPIGSLSGGNQQKVIIARWLIDRPDVLLLDDPTKGIDLSAKRTFALIRQLAAEGSASSSILPRMPNCSATPTAFSSSTADRSAGSSRGRPHPLQSISSRYEAA